MMNNIQSLAKLIHRMNNFNVFFVPSKFLTIISLNFFRFASKVLNTSFNKITSCIRRLLVVPIKKSFSRCFINTSVLIELSIIRNRRSNTFSRNIFNVNLPFFAKKLRNVIMFWNIFKGIINDYSIFPTISSKNPI